MDLHSLSAVHALPLWFLVLTLFFPRVGLLLLWLQASRLPFHLTGIVSLVFAILLPRLLVLYMIYLDLGVRTLVHHSSDCGVAGLGRVGELSFAATAAERLLIPAFSSAP